MSESKDIIYEEGVAGKYDRHPPLPGSKEAIEYNKREAYKFLYEKISIETPDLPLDKIHEYFNALALTPPPLVVFNADERSLILIKKVDPQAAKQFRKSSTGGFYANSINVAFVANDRLASGSHKTSRTVHELSHGTSMNVYKITRSTPTSFGYHPSRGGFGVENNDSSRNMLYEEGRAELLAGQFTERISPDKSGGGVNINGLWVPSVYVHEKNGHQTVADATPAAIALELLIAKNPQLLPILIQGSLSTEGLRSTAQSINNLADGLYVQLSKVSRDYDSFNNAARSLIDTFYQGDAKSPLHAHKIVQGIMQNELRHHI